MFKYDLPPASGDAWQVAVALCNMVFSCPDLSWNSPTDSLELFAGQCSITKGEHQELGGENHQKAVALSDIPSNLNTIWLCLFANSSEITIPFVLQGKEYTYKI